MLRQIILTAVLSALARLASSQTTDCSSLTCTTSGGHIIVTRESDAPSGTSAMNIIALGVANQCPGSDIAETPYPAELDPYLSSEQEGVGNLTELVLDYQSCCPDSKIVLMGYSQVSHCLGGLWRYLCKFDSSVIMTDSHFVDETLGSSSHRRFPVRDVRDRIPDDGGLCLQCD